MYREIAKTKTMFLVHCSQISEVREWLMADARDAIDGSETVGNSSGSASAVATDAALTVSSGRR
jgi:hypothetical protein